jgi:hypothetical protein
MQNNESIGYLLFVCGLVKPDESGNGPNPGFALRDQLNGNK